jgi:hypothetical protein
MSNSKLRVHDVWDTGYEGKSIEYKTELVRRRTRRSRSTREQEEEEGEEEKGLRIVVGEDANGIREVLYEERKPGEEIEGAALLPFLDERVGKYEVEVLEAQGEFTLPSSPSLRYRADQVPAMKQGTT